ncbi:MAG: TIGR03545 family protein [Gemmatimonadales bacterium]
MARLAVFRWRAVGPLLLLLGAVVALWALFADRILRDRLEDAGSAIVGARVEIRSLDLDLSGGRITVRGLTVASPHQAFKNLLEADELAAEIDVLPLLEKKIAIERLAASGLRFGTARSTDGRLPPRPGDTTSLLADAERWGRRLEIPALALTAGVLAVGRVDPSQLATVREARALGARADSSRRAWETTLAGLDVQATLDSATAMARRLQGARLTDVQLLAQGRRTLDQVKRTTDRMAALERDVKSRLRTIESGIAGLDAMRQRDFARARELVRLPSFDPLRIGAALFAPAAARRFEQGLYWAALARRYMPPGLKPRAQPGPARARRRGLDVRFPRERGVPGFLLRTAELSFTLAGDSGPPAAYAGRLTGLTSDPDVYGRPTAFEATAPAVRVGALLDHVGNRLRDSIGGALANARLPALQLPGLPLALDPGRGGVSLGFTLARDSIRAQWGIRSEAIRWARDSAAGPGSDVERLAMRLLTGVTRLDLAAEVSGTLAHPRLSVTSNLDRALADGLRAALGDEVAAAERKLRTEVDRLVNEQTVPVRAQLASLAAATGPLLAQPRGQLAQVQKELEQQLRRITGGIRLP